MADQVSEVEEVLGRSRAHRGVPPLPRQVNTLPVVEQFAPPQERQRMAELEHVITAGSNKKPLELLAEELTGLNFGDMMEFAKGTGGDAQKVWDWAVEYLAKDMKQEPRNG
jgi:hypothetical protein